MQVHYESLHPCSNADILATINLVKEYLENRYRYSKKDLLTLIEPQRDRKEATPLEPSKLDSTRNKFHEDEDRKVDMDLEEPICNKPAITSNNAKQDKKNLNDLVKNTEEEILSDDDFVKEKKKEFENNSQRNSKPNQASRNNSSIDNKRYKRRR